MSLLLRRAVPVRVCAAIAFLALAGCVADSTSPGNLRLVVADAQDSVWIARPGDDTLVRVRLLDADNEPVRGAPVSWVSLGIGSAVTDAAAESDHDGYAVARWHVGTRAADQQELRVAAISARTWYEVVIPGRVIPSVVTALRADVDTPFVVRLGDTVTATITAIDPFGNEFPAPNLVLTTDSAVVRAIGGGAVIGVHRGNTIVTATTAGREVRLPTSVVQYVARIEPGVDSLWFTSLGAELPVGYVVWDDRGRVVGDTTAQLAIVDTTVAQFAANQVRSVGTGSTALELTIGATTATITVDVQQRVAHLSLGLDTTYLNALFATTTVRPIARDSLGALIAHPELTYEVSDVQVVGLVDGGTVRGIKRGTALITARNPATGITTSAPIVVRQIPYSVVPTTDTIRFDAFGEQRTLSGAVLDALGSVIPDAALAMTALDPNVVVAVDSLTVQAHASGVALVSLSSGNAIAQMVMVVDQTVTSLAIRSADPVVARPVGASMPLICEARDRNGYLVARDPVLVGSGKGTVVGSGCANATVQRSGYDTLYFASGAVQSVVPVIVTTRPDSVGVLAAAEMPTATQTFVGENLASPFVLALRPLVADILRFYGDPTSNLDRARAIRDWVARTAIIGDPAIHPNRSTANLTVLPPGKTWEEVNAIVRSVDKWNEDHAYWVGQRFDGYAMLDRLLGTLDRGTGLRADDGLMEHVVGARYRIRDIASHRYTLCTFQSIIAHALWAAAGLQGLRAATVDHDAAAVFIPEFGKWIYEDPTFNEEYFLDGVGDPLSPTELLAISTAGEASRLQPRNFVGPSFDPEPYAATWSYLQAGHPGGMLIMGSQLNARATGTGGTWSEYVQIDVASLELAPAFYRDTANYSRVTANDAFPTLGVVPSNLRISDSVYVVHLGSTYPNHQYFERRVNGGTWDRVSIDDVLPVGACRVEYRSVDAIGTTSAVAVLDVWVPRSAGFVESGVAGGVRRQARLCL